MTKFFPIKNSARRGLAQSEWGEVFEPCDLIENLKRQTTTMLLDRNSVCAGGSLGWYGCRLLQSLGKINKFENPTTKSQYI